jgi:hypothetical protein
MKLKRIERKVDWFKRLGEMNIGLALFDMQCPVFVSVRFVDNNSLIKKYFQRRREMFF